VTGQLKAYSIMATIVGCTTFFVVFAFVAQQVTNPTSWWNLNDDIILIVDQVHGFLFMALLVLIAILARKFKWSPNFTITTMLFATIPVISFWAERRASKKARAALEPGTAQS